MSNDHLSLVGRTSEAAIKNLIYRLPGRPPFMLAQDVAKVYETETRAVNQAVQRNPERFPDSFCFRLTREEADHLRSQNVIINNPAYLPNAFSHAGANMLSAVLTSPVAVAMCFLSPPQETKTRFRSSEYAKTVLTGGRPVTR